MGAFPKPHDIYLERIERGDIESDPNQEAVLRRLDSLCEQLPVLLQDKTKKGFVLPFFKKKATHHKQGLYIYGDVGIGKTYLMNLFVDSVKGRCQVVRDHFHHFMTSVHDRIHEAKAEGSIHAVIEQIAEDIADDIDILCLDELQITDIADAMIVGKLFRILFREGVIIVTTSNRPPEDLYKGGLQRDRFEPFVRVMEDYLDIVALDGIRDYRMSRIRQGNIYFSPLNSEAEQAVDRVFYEITGGAEIKPASIKVKGRTLKVAASAGKIGMISFAELCERALGVEDYEALAKKFTTVILHDVPQMNFENRNEAMRFIKLIDIFYDKHVLLVISAAVEPDKLYTGDDHAFEFERTVSRLIEMRSKEYLEQTKILNN